MKLKTIRKQVEQKLSIDLSKTTRQREYVYSRCIYFKLCRELTANSLTDIANTLDMNHATVLHSLKMFDNIIKEYEEKYFSVYCEILDSLVVRPKFYDEPTQYWMEKCYDLEEEFNEMAENYEKLWRINQYLAGKIKGMGFKYTVLDEPIRRYAKKETGRQEEQRSSQGSLQGTGETAQG